MAGQRPLKPLILVRIQVGHPFFLLKKSWESKHYPRLGSNYKITSCILLIMKYITTAEIPFEKVSHQEEIFKQVFLRNQELPHITNFAQTTLKKNQRIEEHVHSDMFEVFYIVDGEGKAVVNSEVFDLKPGVCLTIEPNEIHSFACTSENGLKMFYFAVLE